MNESLSNASTGLRTRSRVRTWTSTTWSPAPLARFADVTPPWSLRLPS